MKRLGVRGAVDGGRIASVNDSDGPVIVGDTHHGWWEHFWDMVHGRVPRPPIGELLDWTPEHLDCEAGTATVRYEAKREFTNGLGTVQGGLVAAMIDYAMATAVVVTLDPGQLAPTLEMKISYLSPAKVGPLWAHGRLLKRIRTNAFVEGDLVDETGKVLARATATAFIIRREVPA